MENNSVNNGNCSVNGNGNSHQSESQGNFKILEQLIVLLAPESLEVSNALHIINEDFSFKIDEFLNLKEVQKISTDSELILKLLKRLKFIKISDDDTAQLIFCESAKIMNLINVPNKIGRESLMKILKISDESIDRLYKQSLYWIIVSENKEVTNKLDETMRNIKFEDNTNLKFEVSWIKDIKLTIAKKINHHNYLKEADSLKAGGGLGNSNGSNGDRKDSRGWRNSLNSSNEAFSWRKKSDYSNNSKDEAFVKGGNVSSFNSNGNKLNKRERFNSDNFQIKTVDEDDLKTKNLPEIKIDPSSVKYNLSINHKYSFREMFELYEKIIPNINDNQMPFRTFIDDVISKKIKSVNIFTNCKKDQKERSYTFTHNVDVPMENWRNRKSGFESKLDIKGCKLSVNNPLQEISQKINVKNN